MRGNIVLDNTKRAVNGEISSVKISFVNPNANKDPEVEDKVKKMYGHQKSPAQRSCNQHIGCGECRCCKEVSHMPP